jgi:hypothetical protein
MRTTLLAVTISMICCASALAESDLTMAKAVEYPHVGVKLSVPESFTYENPDDRFTAVRAVRKIRDKVVSAVTLSVFPVEQKQSADKLAEQLTDMLRQDLRVRSLKAGKKIEMKIAGLEGIARVMTYTFSGRRTVAARAVVTRELKDTARRTLAYVITVEAEASQRGSLLKIFKQVVARVKLTEIKRPAISSVKLDSEPWPHYGLGFSIKPPRGWFIAETATGAASGMVDYLAEGSVTISPSLEVVSVLLPEKMTCRKMAEKAKAAYLSRRSRLLDANVISESDPNLAGVKGRQFVLKLSARGGTDPNDDAGDSDEAASAGGSSELWVYRIMCTEDAETGKPRSYTMILYLRDGDTDAARELMDTLAGGFSMLEKEDPDGEKDDSSDPDDSAADPSNDDG